MFSIKKKREGSEGKSTYPFYPTFLFVVFCCRLSNAAAHLTDVPGWIIPGWLEGVLAVHVVLLTCCLYPLRGMHASIFIPRSSLLLPHSLSFPPSFPFHIQTGPLTKTICFTLRQNLFFPLISFSFFQLPCFPWSSRLTSQSPQPFLPHHHYVCCLVPVHATLHK